MKNNSEMVSKILQNYPFQIKSIVTENNKGKKAVWFVDTNAGKKVLKKMPVSKNRLFFLLAVLDHLQKGGVHLPAVVKTTKGANFVELENGLFCLFEAIDGRNPRYEVQEELQAIIKGLAMFHQSSMGFKPAQDTEYSNQLGAWPEKYRKQINALEQFKQLAETKKQGAFDKAFLVEASYFITRGKQALLALEKSDYSKWVKGIRKSNPLCHQDFAAGNLSLTKENKLYVFDFDGIIVELPARDLRKIFNKVMKKRNSWDFELARKMISWYHAVNPLNREEYQVLFIDLAFPHLFYGIVSKYYQKRASDWSEEKYLSRLQQMVRTEKTKEQVLDQLQEFIGRVSKN